MSVGVQPNSSQLDQVITQLAWNVRQVMRQIRDLNTEINQGGNAASTLETAGYAAADAATFQTLLGYLNNLSGVYYGTATVAADFDFDNALSVLWGGQVNT